MMCIRAGIVNQLPEIHGIAKPPEALQFVYVSHHIRGGICDAGHKEL